MSSTSAAIHSSKTGSDWSLVRRLSVYVLQHKKLLAVGLVLYPIAAVSSAVPPLLIQKLLDEVVPARDISMVKKLALIYLLVLCVEYVGNLASQFVLSILGQRCMRQLRRDLFGHVQNLSAKFFDRTPLGRTLTQLTNDVEQLGEVFSTSAVTMIGDVITIIAVVGMMFWLHVELTLFALIVLPLLVFLTEIFRRYAREAFRKIRKRLSRINVFLAEHLSGMAIVQLFRQQERTISEFEDLNMSYRDANFSAIYYDALLFSVVEALGSAMIAGLLWFFAGDLVSGAIGAGMLLAFLSYIRKIFTPIRDLSSKWTQFQSAFAAAERCFGLLDTQVDIVSNDNAKKVSNLDRNIEFKNVYFRYKDEESDWILEDVNFSIEKGQKVAIVGATGSGKSSILKLLNRSYDIQKGQILIDGESIDSLNLDSIRNLYAVVLQDVFLFSDSIEQNLSLSRSATPDSARAAAEAVQANEFIEKLNQGYETQVVAQGSNFSVGEKQLLAFARALAADPDVLILDEATSNVDSETENQIQNALEVLLDGRTAVVVAHRLSTIRQADQILVLESGQIVQRGTHDELLAEEGLYRQLVEAHLS